MHSDWINLEYKEDTLHFILCITNTQNQCFENNRIAFNNNNVSWMIVVEPKINAIVSIQQHCIRFTNFNQHFIFDNIQPVWEMKKYANWMFSSHMLNAQCPLPIPIDNNNNLMRILSFHSDSLWIFVRIAVNRLIVDVYDFSNTGWLYAL